MEIVKLTLGPYSEHTYLVKDGDFCCVIDPEISGGRITGALKERGWTPAAILISHSHLDHIRGAAELSVELPLYVHESEVQFVKGLNKEIGFPFEKEVEICNPVVPVTEGAQIGPFHVVHMPGHSPGSCLFVMEGHVFSGDSMFVNGIPMLNFVHSSISEYINNSVPKMRTLDPYAILHAGHGTQGRVIEGIPPEGALG